MRCKFAAKNVNKYTNEPKYDLSKIFATAHSPPNKLGTNVLKN